MEDERNYVKLSLNNLYHEICHRYVHADREHNVLKLPLTCKSVFFIMQHVYYLSSGNFIPTKLGMEALIYKNRGWKTIGFRCKEIVWRLFIKGIIVILQMM